MQYEPYIVPDPHQDKLKEMQRAALEKINAALTAVKLYREAALSENVFLVDADDKLIESQAAKLLRESLFVGAAGEICTACGGSGRKR